MNKKWEYNEVDENKVLEIREKYNISELLATILVSRNIIEDKKIKVFYK